MMIALQQEKENYLLDVLFQKYEDFSTGKYPDGLYCKYNITLGEDLKMKEWIFYLDLKWNAELVYKTQVNVTHAN